MDETERKNKIPITESLTPEKNFLNSLRHKSGSDKPSTSKSISNKTDQNEENTKQPGSSPFNKDKNISKTSFEEKEIRVEPYVTPASVEAMRQGNSNEILTFFQVYGGISDFTGNIMRKTEGFIYMTTPPDGSYGWIILLSSFLSGIIIDGNFMTVATVLPSIEEKLSMKKQTTAFIVSLQTATYSCIGPISSAFINKIGFRNVAFLGLTINILGLVVGSFCSDPISLSIFFGFFFGCGAGMVVIVNQLIVAYYFEKYRAIAVGVQSSSVGIGLLIYGAINSFFTKRFGWSYTFLLMAGSTSISYICCAAFRKIEPTKIGRIVELSPGEDVSFDSMEIETTRFSENSETNKIPTKPSLAQESIMQKISQFKASDEPKTSQADEKLESEQRIVIEIDPLERIDIFSPHSPTYDQTEANLLEAQIAPGKEKEVKELNYRLNMSRSMVATDEPKSRQKLDEDGCCTINKRINGAFEMLFDMKLLHSIEFQLLQVATSIFVMGVFIPYLYITDRSKIAPVYANWLLSFIGTVNIFLRIFLGFAAFYTKDKTPYLCGGCVIIGGCAIFVSAFTPHHIVWLQFFICGLFGIATAAFYSLRSVILINILGVKKLTNAYGLISLFAGISTLIGINLAGILVSCYNNTNPPFVLSGVLMICAGILTALLPVLVPKVRRRREQKTKDTKKVRFSI